MSALVETIRQRVAALPRAMQWAVAAIVVIGCFLLWDATIRPVSDGWRSEADNIERQIQKVADAQSLSRELKRMRPVITSVGAVELPAASSSSHQSMTAAVNEVLGNHVIQSDGFSSNPDRKFQKKFLLSITQGRDRVESIRGNLSFEATPEEVADIVAELESHPAIECIKSIQMTNSGNGRVDVRMALEAWGMVEEL